MNSSRLYILHTLAAHRNSGRTSRRFYRRSYRALFRRLAISRRLLASLLLTLALYGCAGNPSSGPGDLTWLAPQSAQDIPQTGGQQSSDYHAEAARWTSDRPPSLSEIKNAVRNNTAEEKLGDLGKWWLYGPGIGRTALNVGTVVVFPPYALYLVTNAGLSIAGYQPLSPLAIFPDEAAQEIEAGYKGLTDIPGKVISVASGVPFQDQLSTGFPGPSNAHTDSQFPITAENQSSALMSRR